MATVDNSQISRLRQSYNEATSYNQNYIELQSLNSPTKHEDVEYAFVDKYVTTLLKHVLTRAREEQTALTPVGVTEITDYEDPTDTPPLENMNTRRHLGINRPQLARERKELIILKLRQDKESVTKSYWAELKKKWGVFQLQLTRVLTYLIIWRAAIESLEGQLGTTVGTYFRFIRFLFIMSITPFLLTAFFIFIPQLVYNYGHQLNETLTRRADFSVRGDLLGLVAGDGWFGQTELFYGAYLFNPNTPSFHYNIPVAYLVTSFATMLVYLVCMTIQYGFQFKQSVTPITASAGFRISGLTFGAWDFGITKDVAAHKYHDIVCKRFRSEIKRRNFIGDTRKGLLKIILTRIFFNALTVLLLLLSAIVVLFTNIWSYSGRCGLSVRLIGVNIPGLINTITVFAIIKVLQIIFIRFAALEYYKSKRTEVNITLIRLILIRLASLFTVTTILFTTSQAIDSNNGTVNEWINSFSYANNLTVDADCESATCWEEYFGKEFYSLAVTYIAITLVVELLLNTSRHFINKYKMGIRSFLGLRRFGKTADILFMLVTGRPTFQVIKHILDLIYFQALIFLGFFFCPVLPLFAFLAYPILFYLKFMACKYFKDMSASSISDDVTRNNLFYTYLLITTYLVSMSAVLFALLRFEPSYSCGPFTNYESFLQPLHEWVVSTSVLDTLSVVLTHPLFLYLIIYILILLITAMYFFLRSYQKQVQVYRTILGVMIKKGKGFSD